MTFAKYIFRLRASLILDRLVPEIQRNCSRRQGSRGAPDHPGDEMVHGSLHSGGLRLIGRAAGVFGMTDQTFALIDSDGLRRLTTVLVWLHWAAVIFFVLQLVYRPTYRAEDGIPYWMMLAFLVALNGFLHHRLRTKKPVTWRWVMGLMATDVALLSATIVVGGGFNHFFYHLLYYPVLAGYAAIFTSFRLTMVWVTVVSVIYLAISLTVGSGVDIENGLEKALLARIFVMYTVAASVNLIASFERNRWGQAVERERALQQEQVEFSQAVHDTTAQSAYMIGLSIDAAKAQAGDSNPELSATLEAASRLSRSTIWELRHPINMGGIYEGRDLGWALRSHAASFSNITSMSVEAVQTGKEPPLHLETRGLLFSIAHNALTNAYRHARAGRVRVYLEFGEQEIRLSVSDDGTGLPEGYGERGRGFANMARDAQRLGGRLEVQERGPMGGATVSCVMPTVPLGE